MDAIFSKTFLIQNSKNLYELFDLVSLFTAPSEPVTITDLEPGSVSFVVTWRVSASFIINFFKISFLK